MNILKGSKLNSLLTNWPQGAVYTATWLAQQGFSSSAIAGYCQSNWLRSISRGAFVKVGDTSDWVGGLWAALSTWGFSYLRIIAEIQRSQGFGGFAIIEQWKHVDD
jgi:hypothetical protein